jgi:hypothetical protein
MPQSRSLDSEKYEMASSDDNVRGVIIGAIWVASPIKE